MDGIEIYTGYYANIRKYVAGGCALVGISVGTPSHLKGNADIAWRRTLAPTYPMIRIEDEAEYTRLYRRFILGRLDPMAEIEAVRSLARQRRLGRAVLLCYEKPPKFCHRSLVAEWMNATGAVCVREYGCAAPEHQGRSRPRFTCGDLFESAGVEVRRDESDWR